MDPRFSEARFGPWAGGALTDPNQSVIPQETFSEPDQMDTLPEPTGGGGGGAGPDGGGLPGMPGMFAYGSGGMLPSSPDGESNGMEDQTGTVDPFALVQKAVQDFRQKIAGQPRVFYPSGGQDSDGDNDGDEQSFAEGGPVQANPDNEQQDDQQQGVVNPGPKPVDPRSTTKYLAGDGAIQPAVALALEKMSDPQGQMQPAQRMMATAKMLAQKNPDAAGAYLQAKRVLFNGHMGGASAALKKGDMAQAAHHATQAFANVPSDHNVQFAPHPHGLVMAATPHGGGATAQQEQDPEASQVDDDADDQVQSAAGGGVIETDETNPSALLQQQNQQGGTPSYEDGGDTDEDVVTGTVTDENAGFDPGLMGGNTPSKAQPQVLTPEQANSVVNHGAYDQVVDKGWAQYIREFIGGGAAQQPAGEAQQERSPLQWIKDKFSGASEGGEHEQAGLPGSEADYAGKRPAEVKQTDPNRPDLNPNVKRSQLAQGGPTEQPSRVTPAQGARAVDAQGNFAGEGKSSGDDEEAHVAKREKMLDRLAFKQYPWASQQHERDAYKTQLRNHLYGNEKLVNQAQARGEAAMHAVRERGAQGMEREVYKQGAMTGRSEHSQATRLAITQLQQTGKQRTLVEHDFRVLGAKIKGDNPGMSIDDAIKEAKTLTSASQGQGGGQAQQGQGGGQAQGDQRPRVRYNSGPQAGKWFYKNPDGTLEPVPAGQ